MVTDIDLQEEAEVYEEKQSLKKGFSDLLHFLKSSGLCIALNDQDKLFFPDFARFDEPKNIPDKQACFSVELRFPYLPIGLFARLVSRWLQQSPVGIENDKEVWREGFILRHKKDKNSGIWLEYHNRKAILMLNCFGESALIADTLRRFWESLETIIEPIGLSDIQPLFSADHGYFEQINEHIDHLKHATKWLKEPDKIAKVMLQIKKESKVAKTEININGNAYGVVGSMREVQVEQSIVHNDYSERLTVEEKNKLIEVLNELQKNYDLTTSHCKKIARLQKQVEGSKVEYSLYDEFISGVNLTGSAASIAAILWQVLQTTI